jgi:hypothetical protein
MILVEEKLMRKDYNKLYHEYITHIMELSKEKGNVLWYDDNIFNDIKWDHDDVYIAFIQEYTCTTSVMVLYCENEGPYTKKDLEELKKRLKVYREVL